LQNLAFKPIGIFSAQAKYKQQAARQGVYADMPQGYVHLNVDSQFEMALRDLEGFERIWLIYVFHQNEHWRPTTRPPVPAKHRDRIGVFASRSPYRPNPIGICAARLIAVQGLVLTVAEADLLDGTPILDIKPYVPQFDAFPQARYGWLEEQEHDQWTIQGSELFTSQSLWIKERSGQDLEAFCNVQLGINPLDSSRKRVRKQGEHWVIAFRTWRVEFTATEKEKTLRLERVFSGYSEEELMPNALDPYSDKDLHRAFTRQ